MLNFTKREQSANPWWGVPTGGPRTEQERADRGVVQEVQQIVKERLRSSMISSLQSLQTHFAKIDKSGDGLLCKAELVAGLEQAGLNLNYDQIESVWRIVDEDKVTLVFFAEHLVMCTYV